MNREVFEQYKRSVNSGRYPSTYAPNNPMPQQPLYMPPAEKQANALQNSFLFNSSQYNQQKKRQEEERKRAEEQARLQAEQQKIEDAKKRKQELKQIEENKRKARAQRDPEYRKQRNVSIINSVNKFLGGGKDITFKNIMDEYNNNPYVKELDSQYENMVKQREQTVPSAIKDPQSRRTIARQKVDAELNSNTFVDKDKQVKNTYGALAANRNFRKQEESLKDKPRRKMSVEAIQDIGQMFRFQKMGNDQGAEELLNKENSVNKKTYKEYAKEKFVNSGTFTSQQFEDYWNNADLKSKIGLVNTTLYDDVTNKDPNKIRETIEDPDKMTDEQIFRENIGIIQGYDTYKTKTQQRKDNNWIRNNCTISEDGLNKLEAAGKANVFAPFSGAAMRLAGDLWNWVVDKVATGVDAVTDADFYRFGLDRIAEISGKSKEELLASPEAKQTNAMLSMFHDDQALDSYLNREEENGIKDEVQDIIKSHGLDKANNKQRKELLKEFDALSSEVSPEYQVERGNGYTDMSDDERIEKMVEFQLRQQKFGGNQAAAKLAGQWKNYIAGRQNALEKTGRTAMTVVNDILATGASALGIVANVANPYTYTEGYSDALVKHNILMDWAAGLQETGRWDPEGQARFRELGLSANQIYRTVDQENSFLSSADLWDAVGQYGFTAGSMIVSCGGSAIVKGLAKRATKGALKGLAKQQAKRQLLKQAVASTETINANEAMLSNAIKRSQNIMYKGNLINQGLLGTFEGGLEAHSTYHTFKDDNEKALAQEEARIKEALMNSSPEEKAVLSGEIWKNSMDDGERAAFMNLAKQMNISPNNPDDVIAFYFNNRKQDALKRIEDDALDAACANFVLNSAINGYLSVGMKGNLYSNDARIATRLRQKARQSRRDRIANIYKDDRGKLRVNIKSDMNPWKMGKKMLQSVAGEGWEEYAQSLSDLASRDMAQADMDAYTKALFDDDARRHFTADFATMGGAMLKSVTDNAFSEEAIKSGVIGALSTAMGGISPMHGIEAFNKARNELKRKGESNVFAKSLTAGLKGLYSSGLKSEFQAMRDEEASYNTLKEQIEDTINNKGGENFFLNIIGGNRLAEKLNQQLNDGDTMGAKDTYLDMCINMAYALDGLQGTAYAQGQEAGIQAMMGLDKVLYDPQSEDKKSPNKEYFDNTGNFTFNADEQVKAWENKLMQRAVDSDITDTEEQKKYVNEQMQLLMQYQGYVAAARNSQEFGGMTDFQILERIHKNAKDFNDVRGRIEKARQQVTEMFAGREEDVDPLTSQLWVRQILQTEEAKKRFDKLHSENEERVANANLGDSTMDRDTMSMAVQYGNVSNLKTAQKQYEDAIDNINKQISQTKDLHKRNSLQNRKKEYQEKLNQVKLAQNKVNEQAASQSTASLNANDQYDFTAADIANMSLEDRDFLLDSYMDEKKRTKYNAKQIQAIEQYLNAMGQQITKQKTNEDGTTEDVEKLPALTQKEVISMLLDESALSRKREGMSNYLRTHMMNPKFISLGVAAERQRVHKSALADRYYDDFTIKDGETAREASERINALIEKSKSNDTEEDALLLKELKRERTPQVDRLERLYQTISGKQNSVYTQAMQAKKNPDDPGLDTATAALKNMVDNLTADELGDEDYDEIATLRSLVERLKNNDVKLKDALFKKKADGTYLLDSFTTSGKKVKDIIGDKEYEGYDKLTKAEQDDVDGIMQEAKDALEKWLEGKKTRQEYLKGKETPKKNKTENKIEDKTEGKQEEPKKDNSPKSEPIASAKDDESSAKKPEESTPATPTPAPTTTSTTGGWGRTATSEQPVIVLTTTVSTEDNALNNQLLEFANYEHKMDEAVKAWDTSNEGESEVQFVVTTQDNNTKFEQIPIIYAVIPHVGQKENFPRFRIDTKDYDIVGIVDARTSPKLRELATAAWKKLAESKIKTQILTDGKEVIKFPVVNKIKARPAVNDLSAEGWQTVVFKDQNVALSWADKLVNKGELKPTGEKNQNERPVYILSVEGKQFVVKSVADSYGNPILPSIFDGFNFTVGENKEAVNYSLGELLKQYAATNDPKALKNIKNILTSNSYFRAFFEAWKSYIGMKEDKLSNHAIVNALVKDFMFIGNVDMKVSSDFSTLTIANSIKVQLPTSALNADRCAVDFLLTLQNELAKDSTPIYNCNPSINWDFIPNKFETKEDGAEKVAKSSRWETTTLKNRAKNILAGMAMAGFIGGYDEVSYFQKAQLQNPFYVSTVPTPTSTTARGTDKATDSTTPPPGASSAEKVKVNADYSKDKEKQEKVNKVNSFLKDLHEQQPALPDGNANYYERDEKDTDGNVVKNDDGTTKQEKFCRTTSLAPAYKGKDGKKRCYEYGGGKTADTQAAPTLGTGVDDVVRKALAYLQGITDDKDIDKLVEDDLVKQYGNDGIPNITSIILDSNISTPDTSQNVKMLKVFIKDLIRLKVFCAEQGWILFPQQEHTFFGNLPVKNPNGSMSSIKVAGTVDIFAFDPNTNEYIIIDIKTSGINSTKGDRPLLAKNKIAADKGYPVQQLTYKELLKQRTAAYNAGHPDGQVTQATDENVKIFLFPVALDYKNSIGLNSIKGGIDNIKPLPGSKTSLNIGPLVWHKGGKGIRAAGIATYEEANRGVAMRAPLKQEDILIELDSVEKEQFESYDREEIERLNSNEKEVDNYGKSEIRQRAEEEKLDYANQIIDNKTTTTSATTTTATTTDDNTSTGGTGGVGTNVTTTVPNASGKISATDNGTTKNNNVDTTVDTTTNNTIDTTVKQSKKRGGKIKNGASKNNNNKKSERGGVSGAKADFANTKLRPARRVKLGFIKSSIRALKSMFKSKEFKSSMYKQELANIFFEGDIEKLSSIIGEGTLTKGRLKNAIAKIQQHLNNVASYKDSYLDMLDKKHRAQQAFYDYLNGTISEVALQDELQDLGLQAEAIPEYMEYKDMEAIGGEEFESYKKFVKQQYDSIINLWKEDAYHDQAADMERFFDMQKAKAEADYNQVIARLESIEDAIEEDSYDIEDPEWSVAKSNWDSFVYGEDNGVCNLATALNRIQKSAINPEFEELASMLLTYGGAALNVRIAKSRTMDVHLEGLFDKSAKTITLNNKVLRDEAQWQRVVLHEALHAAVTASPELSAIIDKFRNLAIQTFIERNGKNFEELNAVEKEKAIKQAIEENYGLKDNSEFISEYFTNLAFQNTLKWLLGESKTASLVSEIQQALGVKKVSNNAYKAMSQVMGSMIDSIEDFTDVDVTNRDKYPTIGQRFGDRTDEFIKYLEHMNSSPEEYESAPDEIKESMEECFRY